MNSFHIIAARHQLILTLSLVFFFDAALAQDWLWMEKTDVLNPSGIPIPSNDFQFKVLDWNTDGAFDFFISESGGLTYYEQMPGESPSWFIRELNLPELGFVDSARRIPKNFEFIDWDEDGDFDLAADSSRFWWNQDNNLAPRWLRDDSLLNDIRFADGEPGSNLSFYDYDDDRDWDAIADHNGFAYFYLNAGSNSQPLWVREDSLLQVETRTHFSPLGFSARFVDWDQNTLPDLAAVDFVPITGAQGLKVLALATFINTGTLFVPQWKRTDFAEIIWSAFDYGHPAAFDILDFDADGLEDVIKSDWRRHIALHANKGSADEAQFLDQPDILMSAVNMESAARPFFYDLDNNESPDLLTSGDFLIDFTLNVFADGRVRAFQNLGGYFDPGVSLTASVPPVYSQSYPNFRKGFTLSFTDIDHDGDQDFLFGFIKTNMSGETTGSGVQFFRNAGTQAQPDWQADATAFSYFLDPDTLFYADSMFYAPVLIDMDHDEDFDVFLLKDGRYAFYERLNTPEESWQKNGDWLEGLDLVANHCATFADLTRDGLTDLIFGKTDGTLELYENIGSRSHPNWHLAQGAFAGVEVDSLAAPAFADLNDDTILDLIVGSASGKMFYFENASTVDVATGEESLPVRFRLHQNYPNPFNPETSIKYDIIKPGNVTLTIYNIMGQAVRTLVREFQPAGSYTVSWDGTDGRRRAVASGVYVYELNVGQQVMMKKMLLLR